MAFLRCTLIKKYRLHLLYPNNFKYIYKAHEQGIKGNLRGDGWQAGGTLIISSGGKEILLNYVQQNVCDQVEPENVLRVSVFL